MHALLALLRVCCGTGPTKHTPGPNPTPVGNLKPSRSSRSASQNGTSRDSQSILLAFPPVTWGAHQRIHLYHTMIGGCHQQAEE